MPALKPETPACPKCNAEMGEVYELDVPIIENNRDTRRRDKQRGYICRGCLTCGWSLNGRTQETTKPNKMPPGAHPQMVRILGQTLKAVRAER